MQNPFLISSGTAPENVARKRTAAELQGRCVSAALRLIEEFKTGIADRTICF